MASYRARSKPTMLPIPAFLLHNEYPRALRSWRSSSPAGEVARRVARVKLCPAEIVDPLCRRKTATPPQRHCNAVGEERPITEATRSHFALVRGGRPSCCLPRGWSVRCPLAFPLVGL